MKFTKKEVERIYRLSLMMEPLLKDPKKATDDFVISLKFANDLNALDKLFIHLRLHVFHLTEITKNHFENKKLADEWLDEASKKLKKITGLDRKEITKANFNACEVYKLMVSGPENIKKKYIKYAKELESVRKLMRASGAKTDF